MGIVKRSNNYPFFTLKKFSTKNLAIFVVPSGRLVHELGGAGMSNRPIYIEYINDLHRFEAFMQEPLRAVEDFPQ